MTLTFISPNKLCYTFLTLIFYFHLIQHQRRLRRKADELWKGIDQSLFLGPSGSVVWANVLAGRVLYSCLNNAVFIKKMTDFLQKKLSSVKVCLNEYFGLQIIICNLKNLYSSNSKFISNFINTLLTFCLLTLST